MSRIINYLGFIICSTGHMNVSRSQQIYMSLTDRSRIETLTFASVAKPSKSKVACKEADMSCWHVMQHRAWGEGSLSGRCLRVFGRQPPGCRWRVKGQMLLLSCCCIANHGANAPVVRLCQHLQSNSSVFLPFLTQWVCWSCCFH